MGKASSGKKVARAAGIGGSRAYGNRPPWMYYGGVLLLLLLGILGVYNSREFRTNKISQQGTGTPTVGQSPPWYEGFALDVCGKLLPDIKTDKDPYGITTRGDGIIYISPTVKSASGANATLGKFASSIGMTFNAAELQVPGGKLYVDGQTCEGKAGHVYVMVWPNPAEPVQDGVLEGRGTQGKSAKDARAGKEDTCSPDCEQGVLLEDDQLVTLAFLPAPSVKGENPDVSQPSQAVISKLASLEYSKAPGATTTVPTPTTSLPRATTTTRPAATTTRPAATTTRPAATTTTR